MASGIFRHSPPPEIFEPDDEWKGLLKAQMGKELEEVILAAKAKVQSDIQNTPTERDSLIEEYRQNLAQLTSGAQGEFDRYVEQERERRRWQSDLGDALVVSQQDIWDQIKAERRSEVLNEDEEEHAGEEELPAGTRSNRRPIPRSISSNSFSSSTAGTSPNGYQRWVPMTPQGDPLPGTSPNRSRLPGISRASEQARPRASSSTATAGPGLAPPTISTSASSSNLWASARQPMPIQTQHLVDPGEEARKTRRMLRDMWEQSGGAHTLVVEEDDFESQRPYVLLIAFLCSPIHFSLIARMILTMTIRAILPPLAGSSLEMSRSVLGTGTTHPPPPPHSYHAVFVIRLLLKRYTSCCSRTILRVRWRAIQTLSPKKLTKMRLRRGGRCLKQYGGIKKAKGNRVRWTRESAS